MENTSIMIHQPWYARGTPVTYPRNGPAMTTCRNSPFTIRDGPSARGEPLDITRFWLTLRTMFFNTQKWVFGRRYVLLGMKDK